MLIGHGSSIDLAAVLSLFSGEVKGQNARAVKLFHHPLDLYSSALQEMTLLKKTCDCSFSGECSFLDLSFWFIYLIIFLVLFCIIYCYLISNISPCSGIIFVLLIYVVLTQVNLRHIKPCKPSRQESQHIKLILHSLFMCSDNKVVLLVMKWWFLDLCCDCY